MRKLALAALGAAVVLVATAVTVIPADAAIVGAMSRTPTSTVPDDQPLPPYTINAPVLAPILVNGVLSTVRQGVNKHAAYDIETPPNWNGDLVVWAHGYRGQGTVLTVDPPAYLLRQKFLAEGYAWAASSYYGNGFDIRAGVLSSKELADLFRSAVGLPHRTYIAGVSIGGVHHRAFARAVPRVLRRRAADVRRPG